VNANYFVTAVLSYGENIGCERRIILFRDSMERASKLLIPEPYLTEIS
jgi:hypothetical protein